MSLTVNVKSAKSLPNVEKFSLSDPFAVIKFNDVKKKTKVIDNNLDPEWNDSFTFQLSGPLSPSDQLLVEVFDFEKIGKNRLLGKTAIGLNQVIRSGQVDTSFSLTAKDGSPTTGKISMTIIYQPPPGANTGGGGGQGTPAATGGGGESNQDADGLQDGGGGEGDGDGGGGGEGEGGNIEIDTGAGDVVSGDQSGGVSGPTSGRTAAKKRAARKAARANLPNKPIDFQIRFHILEARKLPGANLQPVVKVRCGSTVKGTAVQKSTNNPYWDELIIFSINERPAEFLDRVIDIKVLNSRKVLKDSLIGSFKFDVGLVYDEPEHAIIHKWLLLTDPEDPTSEARGYLKVSINVLGPGDIPKKSISKVEDDNVDIEANLLRPSGVRLQAATMNVKVYQAEDLPQMDAEFMMKLGKIFNKKERKELVDPYCVVNFAGHKGRTTHLACTMNPEWNEKISLGIRVPSMCDRLRLTLKDHDKFNRDDFIGTAFINMTEISAPGDNGFMPTFGPSFVPIYGSPREFSSFGDKYEYLNKGQFDGCAYRGRVMVEVGVNIGTFPTHKRELIPKSDLEIIPPLLRRRSYKLFAAFAHATMINPKGKPVEFEVSIGNFGNKLDKNVPDAASTTQSSNPVYDGTQYHYLPWFDTKPCIVLDSQWEDNTYKIGTLNILLTISRELETGLNECKDIMSKEAYDSQELKGKAAEILGNLLVHLEQPLPQVPVDNRTHLDVHMRKVKEEERLSLANEARGLRAKLATDPEDVVTALDDILIRIKNISYEPQITIPDVIIWMLSGNERVAYKRIPAYKLMYSPQQMECGELCGKMQNIFLEPPCVEKEEDLEDASGRAQLRVLLWLGLESDSKRWTENIPEGQIAVYAETYENQAWFCGKWGKTGLVRPNYSDARGKYKLPKEAFITPTGWDWEDDWFLNPEISAAFEADSGRKIFQDEIFEYHFRVPFTSFERAKVSWRDVRNAELGEGVNKDNLQIGKNWEWISDWALDTNRAVDENGWQYTVDAEDGPWGPVERNIHITRRRRWVRTRRRIGDPKKDEKEMLKRQKSIAEGWEYARLPHMSYHVSDHKLDMARRRRWHRKLVQKEGGKPPVFYFESPKKKSLKEKLFSKKKKKAESESEDDDDSSDDECTQAPRMYLLFPKSVQFKYQFNAYIYQARDLHGSDESGLSDPYAYVAFGRYSQKTRILKQTVCPIWDQTLIFEDVFLFGNPETIANSPPVATVEFFDKDQFGKDEYIGQSIISPKVLLERDLKARKLPRLAWYEITRYKKNAGELLAAFELMLIQDDTDPPFPPPKAPGDYYQVPSGIRPILQKTRIEVLCWGVRDMRKFQLLPINSPLVEVECGGYTKRTAPIADASKNPNFPEPVISLDVNIPKEPVYSPPLNIKILDKRPFGRKPLVGVHVIKTLKELMVDPQKAVEEIEAAALSLETATGRRSTLPTPQSPAPKTTPQPKEALIPEGAPDQTVIRFEDEALLAGSDPDVKKDSEFDWWSKFYLSAKDEERSQPEYGQQGFDKLMVYDGNLEDYFGNFEDLATTFPLYRGKGQRDDTDAPGQAVGRFKGAVKICPFPTNDTTPPPQMFGSIPPTQPVECIVRIYVVRGIDLQPKDANGKSDPYLRIKIGKNKINDRDNYIPNTLNPIFGRVFELPAYLPVDHTLKITVMDYDLVTADDIIGETLIDLENRYLSKHRALCGLPETFCIRGMNKWRDPQLPRDMLSEFCKMKNLKEKWIGTAVVSLGTRSYSLEEFEPNGPPHSDVGPEDERLALHVLRERGMVPEHVETRPLYNKVQPDLEQGRLQMWVDIFPKNLGVPPPPVDISPRKAEKYMLRIVIYNTSEVELDETSAVTGEDMSDIYVKGWFQGEEETQKTDVHYRSMDGEGNFNWRLVFPFEYIPQEKVMIARKFERLFSLDKTERRLPPKITLQVWDNDLFNPDDFIGTLELKLDHMPDGQKSVSACEDLNIMPDFNPKAKCIDLFKKKRVKGWWPFHTDQFGKENREVTGKVEMELEIVTEEESQARPAGKGREEPNLNPFLPEPNRPATSFLWFTSPWKTFKFIIWKYYKFHIIGSIIGVLAILVLVILIYTLPNYIGQWLMSSLLPGGAASGALS